MTETWMLFALGRTDVASWFSFRQRDSRYARRTVTEAR